MTSLPSGTPWERPETVAGFVASAPNAVLMAWARHRAKGLPLEVLDIGCGAGRNSIPLTLEGHRVTGIDLSRPMLEAAQRRADAEGVADRCRFVYGSMERLDVPSAGFDLIVAQGVWNLATTDLQLVAAMAEAARAARAGAGLFVFTFSRATLGNEVQPLPGQRQIFDRFSGMPQAFVTEAELDDLLASAGFDREHPGALTEYNRPAFVAPKGAAPRPVLWEGTWVRR